MVTNTAHSSILHPIHHSMVCTSTCNGLAYLFFSCVHYCLLLCLLYLLPVFVAALYLLHVCCFLIYLLPVCLLSLISVTCPVVFSFVFLTSLLFSLLWLCLSFFSILCPFTCLLFSLLRLWPDRPSSTGGWLSEFLWCLSRYNAGLAELLHSHTSTQSHCPVGQSFASDLGSNGSFPVEEPTFLEQGFSC